MSRAASQPGQQMAYLTIGHSTFLLDASKAMKVAELMQYAVDGDWNYVSPVSYTHLDVYKRQVHHCITAAAALNHWHASILRLYTDAPADQSIPIGPTSV